MTDRTKLGIGILVAAILLGLLGDLFLRATPWGLNIIAWMGALVVAAVVIVHWRRVALNGSGRWLVAPALFFAAAVAWRDSTTLKSLNLLALSLSLALALLRAQAGRLLLAGVMEYALGVLIAAFNAVAGAARLVFGDIQWKEVPHDGLASRSASVARGLAIALPLLLIFGGLLAAADAAFSEIIARTFDFDFGSLVLHFFWICAIAWMAGGYLRGVLLGKEIAITVNERPGSLWLGITEIGMALGLLDLLFLSFVAVQFRYFFGGAERVQSVAGLTYAEYARSGFFELVGVAALALPLLLAAHWLLKKENLWHERIFRALAGAQVILLFVIMISALQRMRLYQREYGLTELRVYTTAFMGWLSLIFGWFVVTVLRQYRERFAFGAVVAGFLVIVALQIINPDALIVRTNVAQARAGRSFDADYTANLSADAVPELIFALPSLSRNEQRIVASHLLKWQPSAGWRRWNWSRANAEKTVKANKTFLRAVCWDESVAR